MSRHNEDLRKKELKIHLVESKTANKKTEERILDKLVADVPLESCSIVSRTGLLVAGDSVSPQKKETFAAMAAIVFSAAEAVKGDVKDARVNNIVASYESSRLLLIPISGNYILVGVLEDAQSGDKALKVLEEGATRLRKEAPWLN